MTAISKPISNQAELGDASPADSATRSPVLLTLLFAVAWLAFGLMLALAHSAQLHAPAFFSAYSFFTFGRLQAASETVLLYGWCANVGAAVGLWILSRLSRSSPRGLGFYVVGSIFWNVGVASSLCGIMNGDQAGYALLQLPVSSYLIMIPAAAAIGVTGVLAWSDRSKAETYPSQWYLTGALFVLPWTLSAAGLTLHTFPQLGVFPAVLAAWAGQVLLSLWLLPLALGVLYYLLPKLSARPIPHVSLAVFGFWALFIFGAWTGTRSLAGGPFPVWIPSLGIAATLVLVVHFLIVTANLGTYLQHGSDSHVLRFAVLGLACYMVLAVLDTLSSLRSVSEWLQFTYWADASRTLLLFGVFSPVVFSAVYYLVPRLTGKEWASSVLVFQHYRCALIGVLLSVLGSLSAGLTQVFVLKDGAETLTGLAESLKPWLLLASGGVMLQLIGSVFLLVNLIYQIKPERCLLCGDKASTASST